MVENFYPAETGEEWKEDLFFDYLKYRVYLSEEESIHLEERLKPGDFSQLKKAVSWLEEIHKYRPLNGMTDAEREINLHWLNEIIENDWDEKGVKKIVTQIRDAGDMLQRFLREIEPDGNYPESHVFNLYKDVFKSSDMQAVVRITTGSYRIQKDMFNSENQFPLRLLPAKIESLLSRFSGEEILYRVKMTAAWVRDANQQNHDGIIITPVLEDFLWRDKDIESLLAELDELRRKTRLGKFSLENVIQRDLEFNRFATEYQWQNEGERGTPEQYSMFIRLKKLPPSREENIKLSVQTMEEINRLVYECVVFLLFLRKLKKNTGRPTVLIGNDRYGRQWVVEPLEDYLENDFFIRYFRIPSHKSMRLSVRHEGERNTRFGFTRDFVRFINRDMPNMVIADSCFPKRSDTLMRISRGSRDYANWIMVFNHLRSQGDGSQYEPYSSFPPEHFGELMKWHEWERVMRQLRDWVTPGPVYRVAHWAPVIKDTVRLGDFNIPRRDPEMSSDKPQVILANPAVYLFDENRMPDILKDTTPYYFDGPEKFAKEEVVLGFGDHGFETRLDGVTTDTFVAEVQRKVKEKIGAFLDNPPATDDTGHLVL